jgi:hypothetical protein
MQVEYNASTRWLHWFACARAAALAAFLGSAASGCMTAKTEEMRQAPTKIGAGETIVVVAKPHLEGVGTEQTFLDCVERELVGKTFSEDIRAADKKGKPTEPRSQFAKSPFQLFASRRFMDSFYPWLEPSTAPVDASGFAAFLQRPGVASRVSELNIRYLVWIDGTTRKTEGGGGYSCFIAPGAAGCLGLGWWEKQSDYVATVWDLRDGVTAGTVSTDIRGRSVMIGVIAPIPLIAPVQDTACNRLAGQLKDFLVGSND